MRRMVVRWEGLEPSRLAAHGPQPNGGGVPFFVGGCRPGRRYVTGKAGDDETGVIGICVLVGLRVVSICFH